MGGQDGRGTAAVAHGQQAGAMGAQQIEKMGRPGSQGECAPAQPSTDSRRVRWDRSRSSSSSSLASTSCRFSFTRVAASLADDSRLRSCAFTHMRTCQCPMQLVNIWHSPLGDGEV